MPAEFYEQGYFEGRRSGRDQRFERRVRKAMGEIADALNSTSAQTVLDIGCSLGYVLEAGRPLGLSITGLDISEHAVTRCRELGFEVEVGTLERLPGPMVGSRCTPGSPRPLATKRGVSGCAGM